MPTAQEISFARKAGKGFYKGMRFAGAGLALAVPLAAFNAAHAPRGQMLSVAVGEGTGYISTALFAGAASAALCLIPGIGLPAAAILGTLAATGPGSYFGGTAARAFRMFSNINKSVRHLEMGGAYIDTENAQRQRFIAIQDMNASLIPGRRYLGQEALLMHR